MKIRRLLIFALCAFAAGLTLRYGIGKFSVFGSIAGHTAPLKEPIPAYTRSLRPNYPYSIIPGGAYTADELRYADQEDPLVKDHYADFDMKKAHMVQLTDDRYQYASYRLKKKVYWTRKKLRIPKGEVLLTDGTSWARARCGNRLSETPHGQVSNEEPPAKALALPPMQLGTPMELAETPPLAQLPGMPAVNFDKFPPVLPPGDVPPPELPPLVPVNPITPIVPGLPLIFPPVGTPVGTPVGPPRTPTPPTAPPLIPPGPPIIPPPNPPVSTVPEPKAVYLFLVTFILSLYGLTRMIPAQVKADAENSEEGINR
jgi:hypothetical protein